jgi:hypothetical protein
LVHSYKRGIYKPQLSKRIYVPTYLEGQDYLPGTNIPVHWETMGGPETTTKVWMSPEEYLGYTTPPDYGEKGGFSEESIKSLTEEFTKKGEHMDSPYLTVRYSDNQVTGHEGRHRAYWAILQGIPKIPVYIVWDDNTGHFKGKKKTKFGKLKPQGFYEREKLGPRYQTHGFYSALDVAEGVPIHMFKIPEKVKPAPSKPLPKIEFTPEQRIRLMKLRMRRERRGNGICKECADDRLIYDNERKQWVCLSCGAIQQ